MGGWVTGQQGGGLLVRARPRRRSSSMATSYGLSRGAWAATWPATAAACSLLPAQPQEVQQAAAHATRVAEDDVGGGPAGQRGGLLGRARLPQEAQRPLHTVRVVKGDVGDWVTGQQRGGLVVRARPPQEGQQAGYAERIVEGRVGGGPVRRARVGAQAGRGDRRVAKVEGCVEVTGCGVLVQLGSVPVQAAAVGGDAERGLLGGRGVGGGRGPEPRPGGSGWRGAPGHAGPGSPRAGTATLPQRTTPAGWSAGLGAARRVGRGRMRVSGPRPPCTGRRCRPRLLLARFPSPRPAGPTQLRSGTPARRLRGTPAAGRLPCPGGAHPSRRRSAPWRRPGRRGARASSAGAPAVPGHRR